MAFPKRARASRRKDLRRVKDRKTAVRGRQKAAPKVRPDREGPIHVDLISVGRELLKGRVKDLNGPYLAQYFTQRGALVHRITIVDDTERAIASSVREALDRQPHLVITTGGLGPANDDRTLAGVSEALQRPLVTHSRVKKMIESAYQRLHAQRIVEKGGLDSVRQKSCRIPVGSEPIPNTGGIAPGVLIRLTGGAAVLCLPGDPEEMRSVFEAAIPALKDFLPKRHRAVREIEAPTADESSLRPLLDKLSAEYPAVWVKSHAPGFRKKNAKILVSLEASAASKDDAESAVENALKRLLALAAGVH